MNAYYHEFQINLFGNAWFYVAIALFIGAALLGVFQRYLTSDLKIKGRYNNNLFTLFATIGAIVFGLLVFFESSDGIIQWFDNGLGLYESPVLSLFSAPFAIILATLFFFAMLYGVAVFASWTREGYLCAKRREKLHERAERKAARKEAIQKNSRIETIQERTQEHSAYFAS